MWKTEITMDAHKGTIWLPSIVIHKLHFYSIYSNIGIRTIYLIRIQIENAETHGLLF